MQNYGLPHLWAQGDGVMRMVAVILILMSIFSWTVILFKGMQLLRLTRLSKKVEQLFWRSSDFEQNVKALEGGATNPFLSLALVSQRAADHYHHQLKQHNSSSLKEWLVHCLKRKLDETTARMQSGLTLLASIGSTAPFIGLFGTVWGIYHALMVLGVNGQTSGQTSLDQIAGPVGETLMMTALGLFVAIPGVLGYNALTRGNKAISQKLHRFAHDLQIYLATGIRPLFEPIVE